MDKPSVHEREVVGHSDRRAIAAPEPILRPTAHRLADGIEHDVAVGAEQVSRPLDAPTSVPLPDEMSESSVSVIEMLAVFTVQILHSPRQRVVRDVHEEMNVSRHLAERETTPPVAIEDTDEQTDPRDPIDLVHEVLPVPGRVDPDVMNPWALIAWPGRHRASVPATTDELEARAWELITRVDEQGGAVAAVESGFVQDEIEQAAFAWQQQVEAGERVIVGVNAYEEKSAQRVELLHIDPAAEQRQLERTARVRAERNADEAAAALASVRDTARGDANLLPPMREALRAHCTVGEICEALREEWGMYDSLRPRA